MYQDETLKCRDCGREFVFSVSEQQYFAERGFQNKPSRCLECRRAKRNGAQQLYTIVCAQCGKEDQVNFEPKGDRPVLCRDCFRASRSY